jgi:dTDP-4-amino-4,6-dideoxygalactose transaminase
MRDKPQVPSAQRELAILGGPPAFGEVLHVGRPNIGDRERFLARVNDILDRRWFTNDGPVLKEFEERIAARAGVRHCIATCNATVALEIAIHALGFTGEVILPSYTFIATAHALQRQGITPVFADMDPDTYNISPGVIERLMTPRTSGIIGVHVFGRPCDTTALQAIADRRGIPVMYDAAHAIGCSHGGRPIGSFGACEVFSFHATKFLNAFEGGAIVTDDDALAARMRLMRNFGFDAYDHVIYLGTNGKMTEVCAAMGLTSLEAMESIVAMNRKNYDAYRNGLSIQGLSVIDYDATEHNNYQYVVVELDPAVAPLNRDEVVAVLHAENVLARKYFWPGCHRMEPYRSLYPNAALLLAETERVSSRIVVLPTGQALTVEAVGAVCEIVMSALRQHEAVRRALQG